MHAVSPIGRTAIPILLYHSVAERPAVGQGSYSVRPAVFKEHVLAIADSGRTALTISQLTAALRGEEPLPARPVLITFDDGFADVRSAVELLLSERLSATAFVTSGWLGGDQMLSPAGARELAGLGENVEVGAHAISHPRLDELPYARAAAEISGSKAAIEDCVQLPVASFAYPHGAYDTRVRDAVRSAGFKAAAAVKNAISHADDDRYALARLTIGARAGARDVERLLARSGAPTAWRRERLRTRGYRSVRRLRRRLGRPVA